MSLSARLFQSALLLLLASGCAALLAVSVAVFSLSSPDHPLGTTAMLLLLVGTSTLSLAFYGLKAVWASPLAPLFEDD
jgi:hypothetical protein